MAKLSQDISNDTVAGLVYADLHHEQRLMPFGPCLVTTTHFLYPSGPLIDTPERITRLFDRLDFVLFLTTNWTLETWAEPTTPAEPHAPKVTMGWGGQGLTIKSKSGANQLSRAAEILEASTVNWKPIAMPLVHWLQLQLSGHVVLKS